MDCGLLIRRPQVRTLLGPQGRISNNFGCFLCGGEKPAQRDPKDPASGIETAEGFVCAACVGGICEDALAEVRR